MKNNKTTFISIFIVIILIIGAIFLSNNKSGGSSPVAINNVIIENGKQIITINAKGGYTPKITTAKADMPTIIKIVTNGTFDCSSALSIPSLNYRNNLPPKGETEIEVPSQKTGTKLQGICAMGMYNFSIEFK
ncbi:MAG: cupredoxin domain-containing protein [Candidatus Paceibacterota bacterium]|jgi:plastocyanin domain-containing protein